MKTTNGKNQQNAKKLDFKVTKESNVVFDIESDCSQESNIVPLKSSTGYGKFYSLKVYIRDQRNVKLNNYGNGVHLGFFENTEEGLIKLEPGSIKKFTRPKGSYIKFLVLNGNVQFTLVDKKNKNISKINLKAMGFCTVYQGMYYKILNNEDESAMLVFSREEGSV